MKILVCAIFASICLFFLGISQANDDLPLRTGAWEIVTTPELKNIPAPPTPKFNRICLNDAAIKDGRIPLYIAPACKITSGSWDGNKLHLAISCPDAPPDAKIPAELTAQDDTFVSRIELNQMITYNYQGRWLSAACP